MKLTPEQALRDLVWAVESPSFVDCPDSTDHEGTDAIDPTRIDADALVAYLAPRSSHRVGRYFESLLAYWLERVRCIDMVGSAIPVRDGTRTIGEIDFLFRDELGRLTHWEVAIKFFLHHPDRSGSHFPGPNASDDFEHKTAKLFGRQLALATAHYGDVAVRRGVVRGRAFYHPAVGEPDSFPDHMAPNHLRGSWMRANELHLLERWSDASFRVTEKPFWLAAVHEGPVLTIGEITALLGRHFAGSHRPLMIDVYGPTRTADFLRLCVVSETWDASPADECRKPQESF